MTEPGAPQLEQQPNEQYRFRLSERLQVDLIRPTEERRWLMRLTVAGETTVSFMLNDFLPPAVGITVYHTDTISSFSYTAADPAQGIENKFSIALGVFERDPQLALMASLHEAGHSLDAVDKADLYAKDTADMSATELANTEVGANHGLRTLLRNIRERHGVELFTTAHAEQFITQQLLGYQAQEAFRTDETEPPVFLHLSYNPDLWPQRQSILEKVLGEHEAIIIDKATRLWEQAIKCKDESELEVLFFAVCADVPYMEQAKGVSYSSLWSNLLDDRKTEPDTSRAGFEKIVRKAIKHCCYYIAHDQLLTEDAKVGLLTTSV